MRFAIIGAGAVGGYFGARRVRAGHEVTFLARGALLGSVVRRGRAANVPTPVLATFYGVLKPHEHGQRPGW